MSISEIHALLALMDDPDETVYTHVRERLLSKGKEVLPFVESAESTQQEDGLIKGRLALLKEGLQQTDVKDALADWMDLGGTDLWKGVQLVHSALDPTWNVAESMERFEALKKEVWLEMNEEQTALEQVRILNHVFLVCVRWRALDVCRMCLWKHCQVVFWNRRREILLGWVCFI
jgi:hypothetical protein